MNHVEAALHALRKGYRRVVFVEDEARFVTSVDTAKGRRNLQWLQSHDWDAFFLGHCPWPVSLLRSRALAKRLGRKSLPRQRIFHFLELCASLLPLMLVLAMLSSSSFHVVPELLELLFVSL